MTERMGEKIGWTVGWLGGFLWVAILSVMFVVQGKWVNGLVGLVLLGLAVACIILRSPWRQPSTPYWKLMLPAYAALFASVAWAVWSFGGVENSGLEWWNFSWVLLLLIPFGSVGRRTWNESNRA